MSIYKEPPPGMFVVPDTVDMTKVSNLLGGEGYWEIGPIKLEEPKRDYTAHTSDYIDEEIKPQESKWLAQGYRVRWNKTLNRCLLLRCQ